MATEKQLRNAAKEFNEVMDGLDPLIDVTLPEKELLVELNTAITLIDPETDIFSEETQAVVDELSIESLVKEKQITADKIHKQNIADKPVQVSNDDEDEYDETPDDAELLTPSGHKQVPIPEKKEKLFSAKASTSAERVAFLTPMIEKGKFTKSELVEKAKVQFPDLAISSIQTMLTDAKNPKYNKFARLVVQDKDGIMSFTK